MAVLALAPEHNATEIQGIQAVLVVGAWKSFYSPSRARVAMKGVIQLDVANSAFFSSWYQNVVAMDDVLVLFF